MRKNTTPRQIALTIACIVSIGATGLFASINLMVGRSFDPLWLLLFGVLLVGTYTITIYYLREYIYRRIKLIYKTIHRHKVPKEEKGQAVDLDSHIIDDIERQVTTWAENQQLELDRYKSWAEYRRRFVGDISHELKTPIFNIQGYVHSVLDSDLEDKDTTHYFLKKAAKNIDRLHTIVEDLGAIARLETGNLMLDLQNFDIKELVKEVFEDLEFKALERSISLIFKDRADESWIVRADRESIRQVLTNLVANSIKYGNDCGRTKVGFYDMDRYILVEVADNGIGIPTQHIPHVFDRFYRVDKSRSRVQGGSGLGLSIVKHIIEAHHQTINVRSTPKLGSTFGFTLEKA